MNIQPIVGVWEVEAPDAPFPWHLMTFTPYHTMSQSNPHEGNREESDSSGQGVWETEPAPGGKEYITGKFVEFKADRASGAYIGKGVITFRCLVDGDRFDGSSETYRYDEAGKLVAGPLVSAIHGTRVRLVDLPSSPA